MSEELKKTGRPVRNFDKRTFEGLCEINCTFGEIESIFWTDKRTIEKWVEREYGESFSEVYKRFADEGKMSLRRIQFAHAKKNATMAIFLGKVLLGQRDTVVIDNTEETSKAQVEALRKLLNHLESKQPVQSDLNMATSNAIKV
jgi:hypothetical protein